MGTLIAWNIDAAKFCLWRTFHLYTQKVCLFVTFSERFLQIAVANLTINKVWLLCHGSPLQIVVKCFGQRNCRYLITEVNNPPMIDFYKGGTRQSGRLRSSETQLYNLRHLRSSGVLPEDQPSNCWSLPTRSYLEEQTETAVFFWATRFPSFW